MQQSSNTQEDPLVVDFDRVVEALKARGITAYVEMTGGGVATIYTGTDGSDPDVRPVVAAGPGWFEGPYYSRPRGAIGDLYIGPDEADDNLDNIEPKNEAETIELIVMWHKVVEWAKAVMVMVEEDIADPRCINSRGERMPATVANFSELHDYVDANEYLIQAGVPINAEDLEAVGIHVEHDPQDCNFVWGPVTDEVTRRLQLRLEGKPRAE